jgi:hypothetical protein
MNKIAEFFSKWGYVVVLSILILAGLFTLGCTIYTAVVNPFVGITGLIGSIFSLGAFSYALYKKIKINIKK